MEENTSTKESKLTYEQLEQVAMQLQQKLAIAESKLRTIDFASMRLTWLFRVIENKKGCFWCKVSKERSYLNLYGQTNKRGNLQIKR